MWVINLSTASLLSMGVPSSRNHDFLRWFLTTITTNFMFITMGYFRAILLVNTYNVGPPVMFVGL
jgi:hypothetical protein